MTRGAAVIGLGNIGQGYDYGTSDASKILTHAHGFALHPDFILIAGVDTDAAARKKFTEKYRLPAYATIEEMYAEHAPEIVSIAVPLPHQYPVFADVISHHPEAVLCEKPLAPDPDTASRMVEMARKAGCALQVNYIRRFDPGTVRLKERIHCGEFGGIFKGLVWYTKGLFNNASHFVDLMRCFFGEPEKIELLRKGRLWMEDTEPDFLLRFDNLDIYFLAARAECFALNQFELLGTRGKISYEQSGWKIRAWKTIPSPTFSGYDILGEQETIENDLNRYQLHVLDALGSHLSEATPLASDGDSALETLKILDRIRKLHIEAKNE